MTTPELSNYISQARTAGQTDDQISQALAQQGWQSADINEALGRSVYVAPTNKSSLSKIVIIVVILLLLLLVGGWFLSFSKFWSNKQSPQPVTQNNNPLDFLGGKDMTCGNINVAELKEVRDSESNGSLKNFPSDFKMPPDAKHIITAGTEITSFDFGGDQPRQTLYGLFYFCTKQTKAEFQSFTKTNNPEWFSKNQELFLIPMKMVGNEAHTLLIKSTDAGDGNTLLTITHMSYTQK